MSTSLLQPYIIKVSTLKQEDRNTPLIPGQRRERITRDQISIQSIQDLFNMVLTHQAPFDKIDIDGQYHLVPTSEGLSVVIPQTDDYIYRSTYAEAEKERLERAQNTGDMRSDFKQFGKFIAKWTIDWQAINPQIRIIQHDMVTFFNVLSQVTRGANFGRNERRNFDTTDTNTMTRQLRFLISCMLVQGIKPPLILYSFALEFQTAAVYRLCTPYYPGDLTSYNATTAKCLSELTDFTPTVDGQDDQNSNGAGDKPNQIVTGFRYFNYSKADRAILISAGSLQVIAPYVRETTHTSIPSVFEPAEF